MWTELRTTFYWILHTQVCRYCSTPVFHTLYALKKMDLKKPRSMEEAFIINESSCEGDKRG